MRYPESLYYAWLNSVPSVTTARLGELMDLNGTPRHIFELAKAKELIVLPHCKEPDVLAAEIKKAANESALDALFESLERKHLRLCSVADDDYPPLLRETPDAPKLLYTRGGGSFSDMAAPVCFVGGRKCSEVGANLAYRFAKELASLGATIVSGMAFGIDAASHAGAIAGGGDLPTVAVLASGADIPTPAEHTRLYSQIAENGLIVSEHPPGTPAYPSAFPVRNRIMAGMSDVIYVAEASMKSGSWHTVTYALECGRDVFASPGRPEDPTCMGSNQMLKDGAVFVTEAKDIACELNLKRPDAKEARAAAVISLSTDEKLVVAELETEDLTSDELYERTAIPMNRLLSLLTNLIQQGIIERKSYMEYHLINR